MKLLALLVIAVPAHAFADVPTLEKVDTDKQPLKLSAPSGWEAHTSKAEHKDLSTIAAISPACHGGPDITVSIQLDQTMTKPAQLLADQYKGIKPTKLHGWDCVASTPHTEVMCAGTLKGLAGVVGVYFATTDAAAYTRFGDPSEFTSQIAASLAWNGKLAELSSWRRVATDDAKRA